MKMRQVFDFDTDAGQLAQRLRHEARLQTHLRFAHFTFDFGSRHECRHRVDNNHIDAARADQQFDDLERLFAVVRLRDQKVVDVDAELLRIRRIERMLGIDERGHAAQFLRLRDHLQRQRRLARRFGTEDFDDTPRGIPPMPSAKSMLIAPVGIRFDRLDRATLSHAHDRALAELLLDLTDSQHPARGRARFVHRVPASLLMGACMISFALRRARAVRAFLRG